MTTRLGLAGIPQQDYGAFEPKTEQIIVRNPVNDSYNVSLGETLVAGRFSESLSIEFTDSVPQEISFAADIPGYVGVSTTDTLDVGLTLKPLSKSFYYDGTPGITNNSITLTANPVMPSFTVVSQTHASGTLVPAVVGSVFPEGAVKTTTMNTSDGQDVIVLRHWDDGSIKHVAAVGRFPTDQLITFTDTATSAANLTNADIVSAIDAASTDATVDFGIDGVISLTSLYNSPFRTYMVSPTFIENHYKHEMTDDVVVWFHVRVYQGEANPWIRVVLERANKVRGTITDSTGKVLNGTVVVDNTTIATYTGTKPLYKNSAHMYERWVGATQFESTVVHDVNQLQQVKVVPSYGYAIAPSQSLLNALDIPYILGDAGHYRSNQPDGGGDQTLCILPGWEAAYIQSGGDYRAYRAMLTNTKSYAQHAIMWKEDDDTLLAISDYPDGNYKHAGGGNYSGTGRFTNGALIWDGAHMPSVALAYILQPDSFHLDIMAGQALAVYMRVHPQFYGQSTSRIIREQTRGTGWWYRSTGQAAAFLPDGHKCLQDFRDWLLNNTRFFADNSYNHSSGLGDTEVGVPYMYMPATGYPRPWMFDFWIQSLGYISELEPIEAGVKHELNALRDFMYRFILGRLGQQGGDYCWNYAAEYDLDIVEGTVSPSHIRYAYQLTDNWADIWNTVPGGPPACGNTLEIDTGSNPIPLTSTVSQWKNLTPSISYARYHNAPGAEVANSNILNASNASDHFNSFDTKIGTTTYTGGNGYAITPPIDPAIQTVPANIAFTGTPVGPDVDPLTWNWTPTKGGDGKILTGSVQNIPVSTPDDMTWVEVQGTPLQALSDAVTAAFNDKWSIMNGGDYTWFQIARNGGIISALIDGWSDFALDLDRNQAHVAAIGGHSNGSTTGVWSLDIEKMGPNTSGGNDTWYITSAPDNPDHAVYPWCPLYMQGPPDGGGAGTFYSCYQTEIPELGGAHDALPGEGPGLRTPTARHQYCATIYHNNKIYTVRRNAWTYDFLTDTWEFNWHTRGGATYDMSYPYAGEYNEITDQLLIYGKLNGATTRELHHEDPNTRVMTQAFTTNSNFSGKGGAACTMHGKGKIFLSVAQDYGSHIETYAIYDKATASLEAPFAPTSGDYATYEYQEMPVTVYVPEWDLVLRRHGKDAEGTRNYPIGQWQTTDPNNGTSVWRYIDTANGKRNPRYNAHPGGLCFYFPPWKCVIYVTADTLSQNAIYVMRTG